MESKGNMNRKLKIMLAAITGAQAKVSTCALSAAGKRYFRFAALAAAVAAVLPVGDTAWAKVKTKTEGAIRLLTTIQIPGTGTNTTNGKMYSFDISWVDQGTHKYYLADRSNAVVDIVDTNTNTLLGQLAAFPPFKGINVVGGNVDSRTSGPNGVTTGGHCLFVTDAGSRVVSFNTSSFPPTQASDIVTSSSPNRADELAFDPVDNIILAINNADTPPFGTFINVNPLTCGLNVIAQILFDTAHGVDAQNGAEQPQWDPDTSRFYVSIPQIGSVFKDGGVVRINPTTHMIETTFPITFCGPAGLTKGPDHDFLVGCDTVFDTAGNVWTGTNTNTAAPILVILDVSTGAVDMVLGVGAGDEVWFNSGDGNYYAASSASPLRPTNVIPLAPEVSQGAAILGVIDAGDKIVVQLVPTFNVPPVGTGNSSTEHPASTAHSVAVDASNNQIYVPLSANNVFPNCLTGCIAVFSAPSK
jgi:hypothetical protein